MNYVCKGSKKNSKHKKNQHIISIEGRSLIRTFLAGATKDAAISLKALSKLERKRCEFLNSPDCLYLHICLKQKAADTLRKTEYRRLIM